ncbi:antigen-presenting glycoprotein CD1d-like isoform X1 [Marmota marmota marmota]|uniref:Antigen-presenting glycoprotein CD1d-like n=1 Tax=Marmota marmota marmota TaxID=9994 RepID=A0A8C5Z9N9_MARMA|nr:antigen-presenting glycoprotein CD1d-like isoform X1 [Marmota marmota marmota]
MGCAWFLLLWVLSQLSGNYEGHSLYTSKLHSFSVPQKNFTFLWLQTSSFPSNTSTRAEGVAWLGELQTHSWSNTADTIRFVKPWARGTFSSQQWDKMQHLYLGFRSSFTKDIRKFAQMLRFKYPMELQLSVGCEVHPGNISEHFLHVAYQGEHILSFQGTAWEPVLQAPQWVDLVIKDLNQDQGTRKTVQWLLNDICPEYVNDVLETGKSELEKQVKPEAWLSSGPSPGPGRLLLVCHVSGFYPKPVWVMWMRGEQEQLGTQRGDILPNADGTWYLRATLDVAAGEAAGLACRVKHSSLGGQDLVLYWGGSHTSVGLVILVVLACLVLLFVLILGFYWIRRHRSYEDIL